MNGEQRSLEINLALCAHIYWLPVERHCSAGTLTLSALHPLLVRSLSGLVRSIFAFSPTCPPTPSIHSWLALMFVSTILVRSLSAPSPLFSAFNLSASLPYCDLSICPANCLSVCLSACLSATVILDYVVTPFLTAGSGIRASNYNKFDWFHKMAAISENRLIRRMNSNWSDDIDFIAPVAYHVYDEGTLCLEYFAVAKKVATYKCITLCLA